MKVKMHVTPNASKDEIAGRGEDGTFRIKVQSPPSRGLANRRLIKFIAKTAGVPKSNVRIIHGEKSRNKILEIHGDEKEIIRRLERYKK